MSFLSGFRRLFQKRFECPVCGRRSPFTEVHPQTGKRPHARCGNCGALERHRLQWLVLEEILGERQPQDMVFLHVAPEPFFTEKFRKMFGHYVTTDLGRPGVDFRLNLTHIGLDGGLFDVVFASHVLEHIRADIQAMSEIARVLKPGGFAVLPVPIIGDKTVEYLEANPAEEDHVRCPGKDYVERLRQVFDEVRLLESSDFPERYQLYCYENRMSWPASMPLRPHVPGKRHPEFVPVCFKRKSVF